MADDDVDTTTPLDGDGRDVVVPETGEDPALFEQFDNVHPEDYETTGRTTLATRHGYAFAHTVEEVPIITSSGVKMSREKADLILAESAEHDAGVFEVNDDTEED